MPDDLPYAQNVRDDDDDDGDGDGDGGGDDGLATAAAAAAATTATATLRRPRQKRNKGAATEVHRQACIYKPLLSKSNDYLYSELGAARSANMDVIRRAKKPEHLRVYTSACQALRRIE